MLWSSATSEVEDDPIHPMYCKQITDFELSSTPSQHYHWIVSSKLNKLGTHLPFLPLSPGIYVTGFQSWFMINSNKPTFLSQARFK